MKASKVLCFVSFAALSTAASATVLSPQDSENVMANGDLIREIGDNSGLYKHRGKVYQCNYNIQNVGGVQTLVPICYGT